MSENYFIYNLYPFQDMVFKLIMEVDDSLCLTGGTALGRHYLKHRYSDDLDLFLNRNFDFSFLNYSFSWKTVIDYARAKNIIIGYKNSLVREKPEL